MTKDHTYVSNRSETMVKLRSSSDHVYRYVRKNERALTYDIGYQVYQRNDGSYVYGFEVMRESSDGCFGSGASPLQFEGPRDEAEALARQLIEQQIERLPERFESERFHHRKKTDEGVVTNGWLIRRIYGYWPAFHDAKIQEVSVFHRTLADKPRVDMELSVLHSGQDNSEWEGEGAHCKLTFLFEDVAGDEFSTENGNVPNWIDEIRLSRRDDGRVEVDVDPSSGPSICLHCATVRLLSVKPYASEELA